MKRRFLSVMAVSLGVIAAIAAITEPATAAIATNHNETLVRD